MMQAQPMTALGGTRARGAAKVLAAAGIAALAVALLIATRSEPVAAFETGQVLHNGNPQNGGFLCSECHAGGFNTATIEITGPDQMEGGSTVTFVATVRGGSGVVAGFNASTTEHLGAFGTAGDDTRLFFNEITHTAAKAFADGASTFEFTWTAPDDAQMITLYAAGVSGNGDQRNSGDSVAATTKTLTITQRLVPGDADGDGDTDTDDVRAILRANVGAPPAGFDPVAADMNSDGEVGLLDALLLARQLNG